jgi:PAS domain S-box-containing protein
MSASDRRTVEIAARDLLDRLPEGCQVIGFDWTYLYVNDSLVVQARRSREQLLGRAMMDCYPGIENTSMFSALRRCMSERAHHRMENPFAFPDGSTGWFDLRFFPVHEGVCILSVDLSERKKADETLRQREVLVTLLHDSVADPVFVLATEPDDGFRFLSINRAFLTATGLHADQIVGRRIEEVLPAPSVELVLPKYRQAIAEHRQIDWEEVAVYPAGTKIGEVTVVPVFDQTGQRCTHLIGWVHDVTARKHAEDTLRRRENELTTTLNSIGDAVIATDLEGRVARMNPTAEALTGWSAAQASGKRLEEVFRIVNEHTHAAIESPVDKVLRQGTVVGLANHTILVARDGHERPIADSGAPIRDQDGTVRGVVLVFRDQTEAAAAEKALRDREELFRGLLEAAPNAMVIVNARGIIKLLNAETERLFGYSRAELVGRPVDVLIPDSARAQHADHVRDFFASPRARGMGSAMELYGRRQDGTEFPIEVALSPMSTTDGTLVTAAIVDMSDWKRAEEVRAKNLRLEMENQRVREASRLKSEFLAHMSHELRTPLNAIIGFGEILYDGQVEPTSPLAKEFLGDILTSGRHLLQLINDVLDLSKVEAGRMEFRPEAMNVRTVVGEVCAIVRTAAAEKRIGVEIQVEPELDATLDPARFKQVLYNYLSNALKFTLQGGHVIVRAWREGADRLRLEVQDSGIGIAPADIPTLFTEFVQLDPGVARKRGGTGLGLALTKRLVEAQGGSVGVTSELGKGCCFFAVLPRHAAAPSVADEKTVFPASAAGAHSVLVVEDDPQERAVLVETLAGAGYTVETAASGKDALAKAGARAFDAITLDLLLPDMSGLDVLAGIRAGRSKEAVVVIVTVVAEARSAGAFAVHDVLGKPFEADALLASLQRGIGLGRRGSVLVVDDDPSTLKLLAHTIERLGFEAICCTDAKSALEVAERSKPVSVILDLLMPEMDGFEFLVRLRALDAHRATPVIVWTAKELTAQESTRLGAAAQAVVFKKGGGVATLIAELEAFLPERSRPRKD